MGLIASQVISNDITLQPSSCQTEVLIEAINDSFQQSFDRATMQSTMDKEAPSDSVETIRKEVGEEDSTNVLVELRNCYNN
ncbi:hypothetical protein KY284_008192 [Solanum tuberosum]|nr:hypothetical protein KY284_008192 [Solanum tuberosum]